MINSHEYKSINAKEYIPMHQETFSKVIESNLGKYYYTKIIGDNLDAKDLIHEEEGYWYWKGHLYEIDRFIEEFKKIHVGNVKDQETKLINRLMRLDRQIGKDVGKKILEVLADIVNSSFKKQKKIISTTSRKQKLK